MPDRILIVEDEPAIADTLGYALRTEGFGVVHVTLVSEALENLRGGDFALALVDIGLPDGNGFDLCRELRRFSDTPVLFLTARQDELDRIVGLEIGGDDYVTKPFSPREVATRVRVILRRARPPLRSVAATAAPTTKPFEVDHEARRIRYRGVLLDLARYEYEILKTLLEHPGRIFSRDQLLERIWQDAGAVFDRTVDTHVKTLRSKLRAVHSDLEPIQTHRGMGYSLRSE